LIVRTKGRLQTGARRGRVAKCRFICHNFIANLKFCSISLWNEGISTVSDTPIYIQPDPLREPILLYSKSFALVIGISKYENGWRKLNNAVNDAEAIASELTKQDFEDRLERDLNGADLAALVDEWFKTSGSEDDARLLLWFAGHGHTIERTIGGSPTAYIVGADAPNPDSVPRAQKKAALVDFRRRSLTLSRFADHMREANARHILVIFDSCFSGGIFSATRAAPPAISMYTRNPARQFISSGRAGQVVSDDGTFRRLFVDAITGDVADRNEDGYVTANELGLYLQQEVTNRTKNRQSPDFGSLREDGFDQGDFVFATTRTLSQTVLPSPIVQTQSDADEQLWALVRDMQRADLIEAYLVKYPESPFRATAEAQMSALRKPPPVGSEASIDALVAHSMASAGGANVIVFYATDRLLTEGKFDNSRGGKLRLGSIVVSIPPIHRLGQIELPRNVAVWGTTLYQQNLDQKRHFTVLERDDLDQQTFPEAIRGSLARVNARSNEALVYIHGYNTSFDAAIHRAAQLKFDLRFDGSIFLYSWPSTARVSQYFVDQKNATASENHLDKVLEFFRTKCDLTYVHFIAEGLGAAPLMNVLARLVSGPSLDCKIGRVILVTPDVDSAKFDELCAIVRKVTTLGLTVYASANDKVLQVAANLSSSPRAGQITDEGPVIETYVDVIDITSAADRFGLNHGIISGYEPILGDVAAMLAGRGSASMRLHMRAVEGKRGIYWKME
jgi:esterase/lipase superfamily enzyme